MSVTVSAPSVETAENLQAYVEPEINSVSGPLNADLNTVKSGNVVTVG